MVKDALRLPRQVLKNSMLGVQTIEGEAQAKPCHIVQDLVVTPLDGQPEMAMPPAVMQNPIPDALDQVPSKRDVAHTRGYEEFAQYFPEKDANWPTLMLIGRDCIPAQWQEQYYCDDNQGQMVSKTPLGWTLMGSPEFRPSAYVVSGDKNNKNRRRNRRRGNGRRNGHHASPSATNFMTSRSI